MRNADPALLVPIAHALTPPLPRLRCRALWAVYRALPVNLAPYSSEPPGRSYIVRGRVGNLRQDAHVVRSHLGRGRRVVNH